LGFGPPKIGSLVAIGPRIEIICDGNPPLQDVSRTTPISPINSDKEYYLVDVVALILKYLKDKLYWSLHMDSHDTSKIQFDWVVAVPAIWDNRGKQMMREAAYKVSTCSYLVIFCGSMYMSTNHNLP